MVTLQLALQFGKVLDAAELLDLASFTTIGTESRLHGNPKGEVLIVYDSGIAGAGKRAASWMADNLEPHHYNVTIAGVWIADATSASGKEIAIFIGPRS